MIKVIIIDDDILCRKFLIQMLNWNAEGIDIISEAAHGKQAFEKISESLPDVALVDISMPVMDGIQFMKRINDENIPLKVIILSCRDEIQYVKQAMKLGAYDYILKNEVESRILVHAIKSAYSESKRHKSLEEMCEENSEREINNYNKVIRKALRYIHSNYINNIFLDDVAEHVNLSSVYFSQLFHKQTNRSFSEYVLDLRLNKAKKLLRGTNLKVYEVCEKSGFTNTYYFCRVFKKKTGMTPREYRER